MNYNYHTNQSFEFLASGSVIYGAKGIPNFPVKLSNEIFNRCLNYLQVKEQLTLYDPCCGGGYLLMTIALLNYDAIDRLIGTDINVDFLNTATKNLSLLSVHGLELRKQEIEALYDKYAKASHAKALSFVDDFYKILNRKPAEIQCDIFERNILVEEQAKDKKLKANLVITDVPYGNLVHWSDEEGIDLMLDKLKDELAEDAVLAIIHNKSQKRKNDSYKRLEKFKVGKRVVEIITLK